MLTHLENAAPQSNPRSSERPRPDGAVQLGNNGVRLNPALVEERLRKKGVRDGGREGEALSDQARICRSRHSTPEKDYDTNVVSNGYRFVCVSYQVCRGSVMRLALKYWCLCIFPMVTSHRILVSHEQRVCIYVYIPHDEHTGTTIVCC